MLSIFIGSSSEARQRGIVPKIVDGLNDSFNLRPWYQSFDQGVFTLETLLHVASDVDLALLIFTKDDSRDFRGNTELVSRDNVVLEYGLFLGQLGRDRVWILKEDGVVLPTDLSGLNYKVFHSGDSSLGNDARLDASLDLNINEIKRKWRAMAPRPHPADIINDSRLGLAETLSASEEQRKAILSDLANLARNGKISSRGPFYFDSHNACIMTYVEALELVSRRFWTTTYMTSGFWTYRDARILNANTRMMARTAGQKIDARRLFLLNEPPLRSAQSEKERYIHYRQLNDTFEIAKIERDFDILKDNFDALIRSGCEVRVACDRGKYLSLPRQINFAPGDSELAIYDEFRVDVFGGGRTGRISDVRIFSRAMHVFPVIANEATAYFESVWDDAASAKEYIGLLEDSYATAQLRIDYAPNWLAAYEFDLSLADRTLKAVELSRVKEILRGTGKWGKINRYLDVGTCTGRYPLNLRDAVQQNGVIVGIDDDLDAVRFADARRQELAKDDSRISIKYADFIAQESPRLGRFDFITCMLGTLSHFGWKRSLDFKDLLQRAIDRFASCLSEDGVLILSTWSEHACSQKDMLRIYQSWDVERLSEWTPDVDELRRRLEQAGFEIEQEVQPDIRLDLFVCKLRSKGSLAEAS